LDFSSRFIRDSFEIHSEFIRNSSARAFFLVDNKCKLLAEEEVIGGGGRKFHKSQEAGTTTGGEEMQEVSKWPT